MTVLNDISLAVHTDHVMIRRGTLNAVRNIRKYIMLTIFIYLNDVGIQVLDCSARNPDLNPIVSKRG